MVFVTEIAWSHDDTAPKEDITFDYGAMRVTYSPQQRSGAPKAAITTDASNPGGSKTVSWSKLLNSDEFEVPE